MSESDFNEVGVGVMLSLLGVEFLSKGCCCVLGSICSLGTMVLNGINKALIIVRNYGPVFTLVIGFVGYNLESWLSNHEEKETLTIAERREMRQLKELEDGVSEDKRYSKTLPSTVLRNEFREGTWDSTVKAS